MAPMSRLSAPLLIFHVIPDVEDTWLEFDIFHIRSFSQLAFFQTPMLFVSMYSFRSPKLPDAAKFAYFVRAALYDNIEFWNPNATLLRLISSYVPRVIALALLLLLLKLTLDVPILKLFT